MAVEHKPKPKRKSRATKPKGAKEIVPAKQRAEQVAAQLERARDSIRKALAGQMDIEQFLRIALTTYQTDDRLLKCDGMTFVAACIQAAQLGLSVDPLLGEAYLIAEWNTRAKAWIAKMRIGYQGLLKRARRSPQIDTIDADVVYENDEFEVVKGVPDSKIRHVPSLEGKPGHVVASYAIARFRSGSYVFRVCPRWEIDAARERSDTKDAQGPWHTDFGPMAMKTALRRLEKLLPTDEQTRAAVVREERDELGAIDVLATLRASDGRPETVDDLADQHESEKGTPDA